MLSKSPTPSHSRLPVRKLASMSFDRKLLSPCTAVAAVLRIHTGASEPAALSACTSWRYAPTAWPLDPTGPESVNTSPASPSSFKLASKPGRSSGTISAARNWPWRRTRSTKATKVAVSPAPNFRTSIILPLLSARIGRSTSGRRVGPSSMARKATGNSVFAATSHNAARSPSVLTGTSRPSAGVSLSFGCASVLAASASCSTALTRTMTRGGCSGPTTHCSVIFSTSGSRRVK